MASSHHLSLETGSSSDDNGSGMSLVSSVTQSFSSLATGDATYPSDVMVLGQPQPFSGHNIFEKGEKGKYTKVNLPGLFKKRVKLWVNYGEMHLSVVEFKGLALDTTRNLRNFKETVADVFNNNRVLFELILLTQKTKEPSARSSGAESALTTKVELPGVYGEAVKLWVKTDTVGAVFGEEIKTSGSGRYSNC
ncbi:hypothetical protein Tsubulata_021755 [Turnera subulata]|uniref:Uncharacterized protein n=1 Tax=Turnera subulata TaxID=218843 RepID=A0A9Q0J6J9_9ROSI|nr:hypothetical protein Tsubulata_021755 [Turnera subulata]